MKLVSRAMSIGLLAFLLPAGAFAITWFPKDFTCPLDNQKNTFLVVGSFGSYIYQDPSKYQWLFFPQTDSPTFYLCKKCGLATYMWDFDELPKEKLEAIRKAIADVKISKNFKEYTEIPVVERLEIMERVYTAIGKEDAWWETFYRVKGYHYGKAGDERRAAESRRKSLALLEKAIADPKHAESKKILFYISGGMRHFLGDDAAATADLEKALATKYQSATEKPDEIKNAENGLNERVKDYIARIKSEKEKPRLFDKANHGYHH